MCGIAGFYLSNSAPNPALICWMSATLAHRGPEGKGYFVEGPVGLAVRRLAVIDLQTGDQPIFNGNRSPLWRVLCPEPFKEMAQQRMGGRRDFSRELWAILHLAFWWELYG